jgi:hypothetical protein
VEEIKDIQKQYDCNLMIGNVSKTYLREYPKQNTTFYNEQYRHYESGEQYNNKIPFKWKTQMEVNIYISILLGVLASEFI